MNSPEDRKDQTPDNKTGPAKELLEIVKKFDQGSLDISASDSMGLGKDQLLELDRFQGALAILNEVKGDLDLLCHDQSQETLVPGETRCEGNSNSDQKASLPGKIDRFEIKRLLGQGGYAKVFLGYDPTLDREVAIKVLRASQTFSIESTARFQREARAVALLSHPNIIPVFETGMVDGDPFIVSEYCPGLDLDKWFQQRDKNIDLQTSTTIISTIANAASHAHQRGIVHRDLKLANILLDEKYQSDGIANAVRVTDFGLARPVAGSDLVQTSEGMIVGTPAYMSPEQASGSSNITPASDIYSMGVMMYQLLTGRLPIVAGTHIETLIEVKKTQPKPLRSFNRNIPKDLEAICLKCLQKDPAKRYGSSFALAEDLRNWQSGRGVKARRVSGPERLAKWCKRNPALTTALVLMSAGLIGTLIQWRSAVSQNARAQRHVNMSQDIIDEMATRVAMDPNLPDELRLSISERAVDLQQRLLSQEPDDLLVIKKTASAFLRLSRVQNDVYQHQDALESLNSAAKIIKPHKQDNQFLDLRNEVGNRKAGTLRVLERHADAAKQIDSVAKDAHTGSVEEANSLFQSGMLKLRQRNHEEAISKFRKAESIYRNAGPSSKVALSRVVFFIGNAALLESDIELAEIQTNEALDLLLELKDSVHGKHPRVLEDVGRCRIQLAQVSLAKLRQIGLPVDPDLALLKKCRQQFREAVLACNELIKLDPTVAAAYGLQGMAYDLWINVEVDQGTDDLGQQVVEQFFKLYVSIDDAIAFKPIVGSTVAKSKLQIADALNALGDKVAALELVNSSRDLLTELLSNKPNDQKLQDLIQQCDEMIAELQPIK